MHRRNGSDLPRCLDSHRRARIDRFRTRRFRVAVPSFRIETMIAAPAAACFELSLSVDAHTASMGPSGERAVAGVTSGMMRLGDSVTWRARHFGIAFRMTSCITEYEAPRRFVDEQVRGPFGRWRHEHTFTMLEPARTLMVDDIEFCSPLGPLGQIADRLVLRSYMPRLIRQRNAWLLSALEAVEERAGSG
jgi:ligand-binding SRPBCC domain-containing protein